METMIINLVVLFINSVVLLIVSLQFLGFPTYNRLKFYLSNRWRKRGYRKNKRRQEKFTRKSRKKYELRDDEDIHRYIFDKPELYKEWMDRMLK